VIQLEAKEDLDQVGNSKFNVGNHVESFDKRKGMIKSSDLIEGMNLYLVKHTDTDEEIWYKENDLNVSIGDVYLTE